MSQGRLRTQLKTALRKPATPASRSADPPREEPGATSSDPRPLLTYAQTAELLGLKVGTLYALVHECRIPHVRLGRRLVRFRICDLERWCSVAVPTRSRCTRAASKLRLVFDAIQATRGVDPFDELDALGSNRGPKNGVGEIRRVLNSFLQFSNRTALCSAPPITSGSSIARVVFEYAVPNVEIATRVMRGRLAPLDDWEIAAGLSHAEIEHTTTVRQAGIVGALEERRSARG